MLNLSETPIIRSLTWLASSWLRCHIDLGSLERAWKPLMIAHISAELPKWARTGEKRPSPVGGTLQYLYLNHTASASDCRRLGLPTRDWD